MQIRRNIYIICILFTWHRFQRRVRYIVREKRKLKMSELRRINSSRKNSLSDKVKYDSKVSKPDLFSQLSSYTRNITLSSRQITRTVFILISLLFIYYFLSSLDLKIAVTGTNCLIRQTEKRKTDNDFFIKYINQLRSWTNLWLQRITWDL